jgi:flagellar hook-basal body complex protein FliE
MDVRSDSLFQRHSEHVQQIMQRMADHRSSAAGQTGPSSPFGALLAHGLEQVNNSQLDSQAKIEQLMSGEPINQAEVFTSVQKADMSFRLLVQIRNKLLQAFEELNAIRV